MFGDVMMSEKEKKRRVEPVPEQKEEIRRALLLSINISIAQTSRAVTTRASPTFSQTPHH